MHEVQNYKDLIVWQKSMDLAEAIYHLTERFPNEEMFELTKQLRRTAVSVPSNIAEGKGRRSTNEFRHSLCTARGSLYEVETQMVLATRLGYVERPGIEQITALITEVAKMLNALMSALPTPAAR